MGSVSIEKSDIDQHLKEQLNFLRKSARDFDRGDRSEYKRMAIAIRILFHETKTSTPLIKQAGLDSRKFLTSCPDLDERNLLPHCGLICMAFGKDHRVRFLAKLDGSPMRFVELNEWWNQNVIWDRVSSPFSRKDLVLHVADKDGGAHVDPEIDDAFQRLKSSSLGWETPGLSPKNPEMHSIRQIAHEVLKSMWPNYSLVQPTDKVLSIVSDLQMVQGEAVPGNHMPGYQNISPDVNCPCGSGIPFGECHKLGAVSLRSEK